MRDETRVATRFGLAEQDAERKSNTDTICYSAAISACEKTKVATRIGLAQ